MKEAEDFNQIKGELINEIRGMRADMTRLFETVKFHDEALYGNKVNTTGIVGEVKELKEHKKNTFLLWLAIVPVILERVWSHLMGHPK